MDSSDACAFAAVMSKLNFGRPVSSSRVIVGRKPRANADTALNTLSTGDSTDCATATASARAKSGRLRVGYRST